MYECAYIVNSFSLIEPIKAAVMHVSWAKAHDFKSKFHYIDERFGLLILTETITLYNRSIK